MHGPLHVRVEILDTEADAIESQLGQVIEAPRVHGTRVHLDETFAARHQRETAPEHGDQLRQFLIRKNVGEPPPRCSWVTGCSSPIWAA